MKKNYFKIGRATMVAKLLVLLLASFISEAQVTLEAEVKVSDLGLHLNGDKVAANAPDNGDDDKYDRYFGSTITAKGDCIKSYGDYVFMTWYRGGKTDRHVMLTRYNTVTGSMATIEFPHRHTGYLNQWWIGEAHNAIAIGISPIDGTIHLLYDMHAYSANRPSNGSLANDYFRYSYSLPNTAGLPDADFTLDKFVQSSNGMYKHLKMPGIAPQSEFLELTYPHFFLNDDGDLFMWMRRGGHTNGMYKFIRYDASTGNWGNFVDFNSLNANRQPGIQYNWGLYGTIKYENGKIRIAYQRRLGNSQDKFSHQNGVYYAYSDNQNGVGGWNNHKGESFNTPLYDSDFIKVMEPGDYVQTTVKDKVHIVGGFDWTVTANEDVHIISRVKDNENNVTKYLHTYKPSGATDFITSEDFSGGEAVYTSGNSVFLIGLKNGRVFVEKAEGGTNNFTRVYEATTGKHFRHGRVHIANGKAYYYLMENLSGSAQPIYLQIIDLDIVQEPFRVALTNPSNGETVYTGETVQIAADAVDENGSISKVEFLVDGSYFGEDSSEPYFVDWAPAIDGSYTLQAVAYNGNNETVSSTEITVNAQTFDPTDLTGQVYRIKNVETGKYLESSTTSGDVFSSDYISGNDAINWTFVKSTVSGTEYYNIDSEVRGVLRGAGAGAGNAIISTTRSSPNTDVDKVWTAYYIQDEDVYRFAVKDGSNFLYHDAIDVFYNKTADITDTRSKWKVELASNAPLSLDDKELVSSSIKVYPNPSSKRFTVLLNGFNKASIVINDMLGKEVYRKTITKDRLEIENNGRFAPGLYLIKVVDDLQRVSHTKLVIR
ncbi:BNR-4 repeat-containing protein [Hyunsoonleella sp. SJ7]|uniref:BNR-4 repeat-containing protein n=1 Tax=Hyunsoonleella aquatilis TaxID=2762758 RepID=A0A923H838_9FLAO|nr:BNR-4 repeat-containing protein [Hyunsoonleella aquatilis]MBC3758701.1 BNR-4 repeat-containing protein [Hyunsoonleella aquatilis]